MEAKYELWDYVDSRARSVIEVWIRDKRLSKRAQAILRRKFKTLVQMDYKDAVNTNLLAGPLPGHGETDLHKLVIHAEGVMLRPLLCRGPIDMNTEYTLLLGAIEKDDKLPKGCFKEAEANREVIIADPARRIIHVFS